MRRLLLPALFAVTLPAALPAQMLCNWEVASRRYDHEYPPGLRLFGNASYHVTSVQADDSTDEQILDGLKSIFLPGWIGTPGGGGQFQWDDEERPKHHGNMEMARTEEVRGPFGIGVIEVKKHWSPSVQWDWTNPDLKGMPNFGYDAALRRARTAAWCTSQQGMLFRSGVVRDLRWRASADLGEILFGSAEDMREYEAKKIMLWPLPVSGTGFPTVTYSIFNPWKRNDVAYVSERVSVANRSADSLYLSTRKRDTRHAPSMTIYEIVAGGHVTRQEQIAPKYCVKEPVWNRVVEVCKPERKLVYYHRALVGELRVRTFKDNRVGIPGHVAGGTEYRLAVTLDGGTVGGEEQEARYWEGIVKQLCGTIQGCHTPVAIDRSGGRLLDGTDDSLRIQQLCARENGGRSCLAADNPMLGDTLTSDAIQQRLDAGSVVDPTLSTQQRTAVRGGQRTMTGADGSTTTMTVPSQWERNCRRMATEDSLEQVNGPVAVGSTRPTSVDVRPIFDQCMRGGATGTPRSAPAPEPSPATPPEQRCYTYFGRQVCVPLRP